MILKDRNFFNYSHSLHRFGVVPLSAAKTWQLGSLWHHQGHSSCWDTAKHVDNVAKDSSATSSSSALYNNSKNYVVLEEY